MAGITREELERAEERQTEKVRKLHERVDELGRDMVRVSTQLEGVTERMQETNTKLQTMGDAVQNVEGSLTAATGEIKRLTDAIAAERLERERRAEAAEAARAVEEAAAADWRKRWRGYATPERMFQIALLLSVIAGATTAVIQGRADADELAGLIKQIQADPATRALLEDASGESPPAAAEPTVPTTSPVE